MVLKPKNLAFIGLKLNSSTRNKIYEDPNEPKRSRTKNTEIKTQTLHVKGSII